MIPRSLLPVHPLALLTLLAGMVSFTAPAADVGTDMGIAVEPGVNPLIRRILEDPHRDFSRLHGPDDCRTEAVYHETERQLGDYVDAPEQQSQALKDYLLAGETECNCTRALIGKYFDYLLGDLELTFDALPCL